MIGLRTAATSTSFGPLQAIKSSTTCSTTHTSSPTSPTNTPSSTLASAQEPRLSRDPERHPQSEERQRGAPARSASEERQRGAPGLRRPWKKRQDLKAKWSEAALKAAALRREHHPDGPGKAKPRAGNASRPRRVKRSGGGGFKQPSPRGRATAPGATAGARGGTRRASAALAARVTSGGMRVSA
jgi:hypothetical protein